MFSIQNSHLLLMSANTLSDAIHLSKYCHVLYSQTVTVRVVFFDRWSGGVTKHAVAELCVWLQFVSCVFVILRLTKKNEKLKHEEECRPMIHELMYMV